MNGLGFTKYTARYMAKIAEEGIATTLVQQWGVEALAAGCYRHLSKNSRPPIAVWPFFGGTANCHALNLFGDDVITWSGTVTHNSNGITGDGSTGVGTSEIIPSQRLQSYITMAYGVYIRTNSAADVAELGCANEGYVRIYPRSAAGSIFAYYGPALSASAVHASSLGLTHFNKRSATLNSLLRNGVGVAANVAAWSNMHNAAVTILTDGIGGRTARNCAFAFFADNVALNDNAALYAVIQAFQTVLARQV